ncbi:hypothetical protein Vadar_011556 [Vaccinium darrowii]|uniref:Uncharacterized protein n=1 Tax=Vaccinium darrowii TaxID=229202 RepID=A0ACB7XY92_9ERIC|nr:hypothetical protein Vadar_011556 [Vaccinium darrowii]
MNSDSDSDTDRLNVLHMLERSLVPNPPATVDRGDVTACPAAVLENVAYLKDSAAAKPAPKVFLALCIAEGSRRGGRDCREGGGGAGVIGRGCFGEGVGGFGADVHGGRGGGGGEGARAGGVDDGGSDGEDGWEGEGVCDECFGGGFGEEEEGVLAPPEEMARAVELALQGDCSARGRRKGAQLLKILRQSEEVDLAREGG